MYASIFAVRFVTVQANRTKRLQFCLSPWLWYILQSCSLNKSHRLHSNLSTGFTKCWPKYSQMTSERLLNVESRPPWMIKVQSKEVKNTTSWLSVNVVVNRTTYFLLLSYVSLLLSMYSYYCIMYSYCCLCILIVSICILIVVLCILIVVYVFLLLYYVFVLLPMYSYC